LYLLKCRYIFVRACTLGKAAGKDGFSGSGRIQTIDR
jgi:hypothetical protein